MLKEFRAFLTKSNALALAIGVIIGAAVSNVVSALASDILMPFIGLFLPGGSWREAKLLLKTTTDASGKVIESAVLYGHFLGTLIDFVIISMIIFFVTKALIRPAAPAAPPEPTKTCPECLETIPQAARRCRACTAEVGAV